MLFKQLKMYLFDCDVRVCLYATVGFVSLCNLKTFSFDFFPLFRLLSHTLALFTKQHSHWLLCYFLFLQLCVRIILNILVNDTWQDDSYIYGLQTFRIVYNCATDSISTNNHKKNSKQKKNKNKNQQKNQFVILFRFCLDR